MKKLPFLLSCASVFAAPLSFAASCPDYASASNLPSYPSVQEESFNHFGSKVVSSLYRPYHMVQDAVIKAGDTGQIVGKFDYDLALHKDLEDEQVQVFIYGTGMQGWSSLGEYTTNSDGKIYVPINALAPGEYAVHMVVKGDLSSVNGYVTVVDPGRDAVLFDIDGTLTLNDFEAVGDYVGIGEAQAYYYAPETVNAYKDKHYQVLYLSARPYWLAKDSRGWLASQGLLPWHLHTNPNGELLESHDAAQFKADYIQQLQNAGLNIIRVYGNATTDIEAYERAGIPKSETYIIGDHAGESGTQALDGDYAYHYSTVVAATSNSSCGS